MTTKEWLSRAINIDKEIGRLMREKRKAWDRAVSITSRVNATCVTGTKDPHKYDKLAEYEDMIDQRVDELYETKQEIQLAIAKLDNPIYRELLQRRYIDNKPLEVIAVENNYSYRHTCRLHGKALLAIEKMALNVL